MPTFDIEREVINAYKIGDKYLFKEYFDQDELFGKLEGHYNSDKYRFEVEEESKKTVSQILEDYFYELKVEQDIQSYCVVQDRTKDSSDLLRNSVATQTHKGKDIFLMKDDISTQQAVEKGSTSLEKSEVDKEGVQWKID